MDNSVASSQPAHKPAGRSLIRLRTAQTAMSLFAPHPGNALTAYLENLGSTASRQASPIQCP